MRDLSINKINALPDKLKQAVDDCFCSKSRKGDLQFESAEALVKCISHYFDERIDGFKEYL